MENIYTFLMLPELLSFDRNEDKLPEIFPASGSDTYSAASSPCHSFFPGMPESVFEKQEHLLRF